MDIISALNAAAHRNQQRLRGVLGGIGEAVANPGQTAQGVLGGLRSLGAPIDRPWKEWVDQQDLRNTPLGATPYSELTPEAQARVSQQRIADMAGNLMGFLGPIAVSRGMTVPELVKAMEAEYASKGVRGTLKQKPGGVLSLDDLYVAPQARGQGLAHEVLTDLERYADLNKRPMSLIPFSAQGETPEGVLKALYAKHGFTPDPEFPVRMVREPAAGQATVPFMGVLAGGSGAALLEQRRMENADRLRRLGVNPLIPGVNGSIPAPPETPFRMPTTMLGHRG